ncbi:kinesin-like protein klp-20 [Drosophila ficusphila]|uniref:kinesin-like protein klp-20 n=1 Tax=Drosophila ficusphila TaxID=30025 RepID=UPI0007E870BB|nr:kinesin-like protein klp-20 [Drosophila ficusphila]
MHLSDEGCHHGRIRVYLFRRLVVANEKQNEVSEEAVAEVLDQVLGGRTSTIFSCGGVSFDDPADKVHDILSELFTSVYSLEQNKEVHVSVRHVQFSGKSNDPSVFFKRSSRRFSRDHFVATDREVHAYIEKVMGKVNQADELPHFIFTVCVKQTRGGQSRKCSGKLQLVYLRQLAEDSPPLDSDTPVDTLVNLFQALAQNPKTHIRYHNIRLVLLLKQLMGSGSRTVLVNYSHAPERRDNLVVPTSSPLPNQSLPADVWRAMFRQERRRYQCLRKKVLGMVEGKKDLKEFLESLEANKTPEEEEERRDKEKQESYVEQMLKEIRSEAVKSINLLQDLQSNIDQLKERNSALEQQLEQKNCQLLRQSFLLRTALSELKGRKRKFQEHLAKYSDNFQDMWHRHSLDIQQQEQVQRLQISQALDAICQEDNHPTEVAVAEEPSGRP